MKTTIEALKDAGVRDQVKVMVGGAPVTQQYAEEIGADGYSENASFRRGPRAAALWACHEAPADRLRGDPEGIVRRAGAIAHTRWTWNSAKGLHDFGAKAMRREIQARIDAADAGPCEAVALGYGLCGNGLAGVEARTKPLVLPRAHDCITLLMGSRQTFDYYFGEHTGVYYRSAGWVERGQGLVAMARYRTGLPSRGRRWWSDTGRTTASSSTKS